MDFISNQMGITRQHMKLVTLKYVIMAPLHTSNMSFWDGFYGQEIAQAHHMIALGILDQETLLVYSLQYP